MKEQMNLYKDMTVCLPQQEIDRIYHKQQRIYWEADFINRCSDRRQEETGLCNLPYETLPGEETLLETAYHIYCRKEDCNISYNDTLDAVIDEIEQQLADGNLIISSKQPVHRVALVIENGIIGGVYSSSPDIYIEITELDKDYASSEQRDAVYEALQKDPNLQTREYYLEVPGYETSVRMEDE